MTGHFTDRATPQSITNGAKYIQETNF